jgi:prepilin-type processing-associated H-X9-DG protein
MECKAYGMTRADVVVLSAVVLVCLWLCLRFVLPVLENVQIQNSRLRCGTNLVEIGKAMVAYANDYDGVLPVAGGQGTVWGAGLNDWKAESRGDAFGFDPNGTGGEATVSASLYLLVRSGRVSPELFVCPEDKGTGVFRPEKYGIGAGRFDGLWDFGPDPARHCSYAYHMPYSQFRLTTSAEPHLAVAADRSPWIDGPRRKAAEFSPFQPDLAPFNATAEEAHLGNSLVHGSDAQNVLFLDGHVEFAKRAFCSLKDDNVYTSWDGDDRIRGVPPVPYQSQPTHEHDSLLVNDPPRAVKP